MMIERSIEWIKSNRFKVLGILAITALIMFLYVDNTIRINVLLAKIQTQEVTIRDIKAYNELLKSQIIELESAERITKIAEEKLGLTKPNKVPNVIEKQKNK
ncbi:Cell division protein FtsL [bioreactor metagenome]|uniref:Cell division protein FtsL n=1 Tax=bioreactor metagenome TaxID=1076179 RepID=A0A645BNE0_9ZZZZ